MSKLIIREYEGFIYAESPLDYIAYGLAIEDHYSAWPAYEIIGTDRYTLDHEHALKQEEVKDGPSD